MVLEYKLGGFVERMLPQELNWSLLYRIRCALKQGFSQNPGRSCFLPKRGLALTVYAASLRPRLLYRCKKSQGCKLLESLNVSHCPLLTDLGLEYLSKGSGEEKPVPLKVK